MRDPRWGRMSRYSGGAFIRTLPRDWRDQTYPLAKAGEHSKTLHRSRRGLQLRDRYTQATRGGNTEGNGGPEKACSPLFGAAERANGAKICRLARMGSSAYDFHNHASVCARKMTATPKCYFLKGLIGLPV